jgi:outer membrane protein TolC
MKIDPGLNIRLNKLNLNLFRLIIIVTKTGGFVNKALITMLPGFIFFLIPIHGQVIRQGETLTLTRCIEIGLKNNPGIKAAQATLEATKAKTGITSSNLYPQVSWSTAFSKNGADSVTGTTTSDRYSTGLSLTQNVYDFGRTKTQVSIDRIGVSSVSQDLQNTINSVIFTITQAYYSLTKAQQSRDVAAETVRQFTEHLKQAQGFYEVGTKSRFDVTKAEVDLSNAKLNLIRAENAVKIARANLDNAIGAVGAPEYAVVADFSFKKYDISFEDALKNAYQYRADLNSAILRSQSAEKSVLLARKGYSPSISGVAGYNWSGADFPLYSGWNVGISISVPVFNGFSTREGIKRAKADYDAARAQAESVAQQVYLDVKQAYLALKENEETIRAAELSVKLASENLEIANGRYAAGVGNPVEVTDAIVAYANAKTAYINAINDYKIAEAALKKAMGVQE